MRRPLFHRPKLKHRLPITRTQEAHSDDKTPKEQSWVAAAMNDKKLSNWQLGGLVTVILGAIVWLGQDNEPAEPQQNRLALPQQTAPEAGTTAQIANTTSINYAKLAPIPAIVPAPTPTLAPSAMSDNTSLNSQNPLLQINQQALELANKGDAYLAVSQLENALLQDPNAGVLFDNLRRLYAGFATQSYQLALDPTKNQPILVDLSDGKKKVTVNIPPLAHMAKRTNDLALLDNNKLLINMPVLAPLTLETTSKNHASTVANNIENKPATQPVIAHTNNDANSTTIKTPPTVTTPVEPPKPVGPPPITAEERKEINTAIMNALKKWAEAWSKQDADSYIAAYSRDFSPKGVKRKDWEDYRRLRIKTPKFVNVQLKDQKAILTDRTNAKVSFTQHYSSDTLKSSNTKQLELQFIDNQWLITYESGR